MFDLNRIATFVQTVQAGSFAAAGRRLGLPANTVSRRVQQLEAELATRLLHRTTRKLSLTVAGQLFFDRCAPGIDGVQSARHALLEASSAPGGMLRVTGPADFFEHFQPEWIAEFMARHPKLQIEFRLTDAISDLVGDAIDLAFRGGTLPDSQFVARRLFDVEMVLVASPAYLAAHGVPTDVAALARHECLALSAPSQRTLWHLDGPDGPSEVRVAGRFSANSARGLLGAAQAGLGIALLPSLLVDSALRDGRLQRVLPAFRHSRGGLHAVFPNRAQRSPAAVALVDFFVEKTALNAAWAGPWAAAHEPLVRRA